MNLRAIRYWISILLLVIIWVFSSVALTRVDLQFDVSRDNINSIEENNANWLKTIDAPIVIRAYFQNSSEESATLRRLFRQMAAINPRVRYELIDLDYFPEKAAKDNVVEYGSVVVEVNGQKRQIFYSDLYRPSSFGKNGFSGEYSIFSAIQALISKRDFQILFLTGSGERSVDSADRSSLFQWSRLLENDGWKTARIDPEQLMGVPDDKILVIAAPRHPYKKSHQIAILNFIESGGRCIVLGEDYSSPILSSILGPMGVVIGQRYISDPAASFHKSPIVLFPIPKITPITQQLKDQELVVVMPTTVSLDISRAHSKVPLLSTSTDQCVAAILSFGEGGVIVVGDTDWVSNQAIQSAGNRQLSLNIVRFLSGDVGLHGIDTHGAIESPLILSGSEWKVALAILFFPVGILVLFLWVTRGLKWGR